MLGRIGKFFQNIDPATRAQIGRSTSAALLARGNPRMNYGQALNVVDQQREEKARYEAEVKAQAAREVAAQKYRDEQLAISRFNAQTGRMNAQPRPRTPSWKEGEKEIDGVTYKYLYDSGAVDPTASMRPFGKSPTKDNEKQWQWIRSVLTNPKEYSDQEVGLARMWAQKGNMEFEMTSDGDIKLSTGSGGKLTTGTTSEIQKQNFKYGEAKVALQDARANIEAAPSYAFGRVGEAAETIGSTLQQLDDILPGAGKLGRAIFDETSQTMRTQARVVEGRMLPIMTGDERFTDGDVRRAREAIAILEGDATQPKALEAFDTIDEMLDRLIEYGYDTQESGALQQPDAIALENQGMTAEEIVTVYDMWLEATGQDPDEFYGTK